jgi:hypothetical protein
MLSVTGSFEREEPFSAGSNTAAAAGAALWIDPREAWVRIHGMRLEAELKLFPTAAVDLWPSIITRARRDQHRRRLLAGPAAGEAELVVGGLIFHGGTCRGAACRAPA